MKSIFSISSIIVFFNKTFLKRVSFFVTFIFSILIVFKFSTHNNLYFFSNIFLLLPFMLTFLMPSLINLGVFHTHFLTRSLKRVDFFYGSFLFSFIPIFLLFISILLLGFTSFFFIGFKEGFFYILLYLTLLIPDFIFFSSISYCSSIHGFKLMRFIFILIPGLISLIPIEHLPILQWAYAFPFILRMPENKNLFQLTGGIVHILEVLTLSFLVLLSSCSMYLKKDLD